MYIGIIHSALYIILVVSSANGFPDSYLQHILNFSTWLDPQSNSENENVKTVDLYNPNTSIDDFLKKIIDEVPSQILKNDDQERKETSGVLQKLHDAILDDSLKRVKVFFKGIWHTVDLGAVGSSQRIRAAKKASDGSNFISRFFQTISSFLSGCFNKQSTDAQTQEQTPGSFKLVPQRHRNYANETPAGSGERMVCGECKPPGPIPSIKRTQSHQGQLMGKLQNWKEKYKTKNNLLDSSKQAELWNDLQTLQKETEFTPDEVKNIKILAQPLMTQNSDTVDLQTVMRFLGSIDAKEKAPIPTDGVSSADLKSRQVYMSTAGYKVGKIENGQFIPVDNSNL